MEKSEFTPQATIALCNYGGIELMFTTYPGDDVFYRFNYGQDIEQESIYTAEIRYSDEVDDYGAPYFIHEAKQEGGKIVYSVYYLSEAIKIEREQLPAA